MRFMILRKADSAEGLPDGLNLGSTGARVSFSAGTPTVLDGVPAGKAAVTALTMIDVDSKQDAIEWVKRLPARDRDEEIEIREGGCPGGVATVIRSRTSDTESPDLTRFMVILKADHNAEAGVLPPENRLAAMTRHNEAAVKAGVKKVVASSSASVYGMAEQFPTPESHHPYHNDTFYGAAKAFNEGMLRSFEAMYGLNYVALRYFNVYGPRMDAHGRYTEVLIRWMERIEAGRPPLILGDGQQTMDFVHVADIARANILAARADATGTVYNIATGTETSLLELATALQQVMGSQAEPEFGPARSVNSVTRRLADISAAQRDLGWRPSIALHDGLADLVGWWRAQR